MFMVLSLPDELMENQMLQYNQIALNISDRPFTFFLTPY